MVCDPVTWVPRMSVPVTTISLSSAAFASLPGVV